MKTGLKTGFPLRTSVAALSLCLLSGNAWGAPGCAQPRDMTALQVAALQQQLMVAALTCHDAADYNRFVLSHRRELQESDRALMSFFVRQDARKGSDDYNAYKTRLANDSSMRSVRDPRFCRSANAVFADALDRRGSLAELVSQQPSLIGTDYESCTPSGREPVLMADATPNLPARHRALPDSRSSDLAPDLTSRMDRALPPVSPRRDEARVVPPRRYHEDPRYARQNPARNARDADNRNADAPGADDPDAYEQGDGDGYDMETPDDPNFGDDAPRYDPEYADNAPPPRAYGRNGESYGDGYGEGTGGNYENRDGNDYGPSANNAPGAVRDAYDGPNVPYAYRPGARWLNAHRSYAHRPYAPPRPRLVRGPDGRWYLLRRYRR